jgi:hypothetical protein
MRLWSLNPKYLDSIGLVALWRESLLAQKVLQGKTRGYTNHPQLIRFKQHTFPFKAISGYLMEVWRESKKRGYNFDQSKIGVRSRTTKIVTTSNELKHEFDWLKSKLRIRNPAQYRMLLGIKKPECHPSFRIIEKR